MRNNLRLPLRLTALALVLSAPLALMPYSAAQAQFNAFKDPTAAPSTGGSGGTTSGPDLKAKAEKIEAGKITVGATAYVITTFKNNGTAPVNITGINLYPSSTVSSQVSLNKCAEAALPPEGECAVTVAVTGLQLGAWRVEVLLDHDGKTRMAVTSVSGTVEGSGQKEDDKVKPDVEAVPESLDFGAITGNLPLVKAVLFRNRAPAAVSVKDISLNAPTDAGFSIKPDCPAKLEPGESCNVAVTWKPYTKGAAQGVMTFRHSAKSSLTQVEVKGSYTPAAAAAATAYPEPVSDAGLLVSDKDKIDFGSDVTGVAAISASIVNSGPAELTLNNIRLAGSDNGLSLARNGCKAGIKLKPAEACAITVNWVPSRAGAVIDDLQIQHNGARGILVIPVRGTATAAVSRDSSPIHQSTADGAVAAPVAPVLDGYSVSSLSPNRAVINGPVGSLVVHDGEDTVIAGTKWTVTILSTGVTLSSNEDEILLVFDKSLKSKAASTPVTTTSSSTGTATSSSSSSASSPSSAAAPSN